MHPFGGCPCTTVDISKTGHRIQCLRPEAIYVRSNAWVRSAGAVHWLRDRNNIDVHLAIEDVHDFVLTHCDLLVARVAASVYTDSLADLVCAEALAGRAGAKHRPGGPLLCQALPVRVRPKALVVRYSLAAHVCVEAFVAHAGAKHRRAVLFPCRALAAKLGTYRGPGSIAMEAVAALHLCKLST